MLTAGVRTLSARGLEYREFQPDPALAADVEYLWTMRASHRLEAPLAHTSASKASLDLIVRLEGNFCAQAEERLFGRPGPGAYLVGALSQPRTILTAGRCVAAGARFRPGRAHALLGLPMHELTDRVLALATVDARACRIARVRQAMALLPLRGGATWADVALSCGFYDQAHLTREFRALAGATPSRFAEGCAAPPEAGRGMSHPSKTERREPGTVRAEPRRTGGADACTRRSTHRCA